MKTLFLSTLSLVLVTNARADDGNPSPFEAEMHRLSTGNVFETRESMVTIGGLEYRKIVVEGKTFFVQATGRNDELREIHCGGNGFSRGGADVARKNVGENRVEAGVKIAQRTKAFVSLLQESCANEGGMTRSYLALDPEVGLKFDDQPNDAIKNKKLYMNPAAPNGLGFSGTW